jgi:hypothetical protein
MGAWLGGGFIFARTHAMVSSSEGCRASSTSFSLFAGGLVAGKAPCCSISLRSFCTLDTHPPRQPSAAAARARARPPAHTHTPASAGFLGPEQTTPPAASCRSSLLRRFGGRELPWARPPGRAEAAAVAHSRHPGRRRARRLVLIEQCRTALWTKLCGIVRSCWMTAGSTKEAILHSLEVREKVCALGEGGKR